MRLGRKNLLYSGFIAGLLLCFLIIYFVLMLPSLYVDYVEGEYLKAVVKQHRGYLSDKSYDKISIKYPSNSVTIELPKDKNNIYVTGKGFSVSIELKSQHLLGLVDEIREGIEHIKEEDFDAASFFSEENTKKWNERIKKMIDEMVGEYQRYEEANLPFKITVVSNELVSKESAYYNAQSKFHYVSDSIFVMEFKIQDGENNYSNYVAFTMEEGNIYLSTLSTMTPRMNELTPIVMQSLPMIMTVTILIVLVFSILYSQNIVQPIEELERYTRSTRINKNIMLPKKYEKGKDEIADLGLALHNLYQELQLQNEALEKQNQELEEDYKRQEVFLKSSSHQLKTPIAAALLLVEGMINKVGKYKDTEVYLQEVKIQLLSMKKKVEDILYLSQCKNNIQLQEVNPVQAVMRNLENYHILLKEKNIDFKGIETISLEVPDIVTDLDLFNIILDNLLSNGVRYSTHNSELIVQVGNNEIVIVNQGHIPEELLNHIFEPFVTGNENPNSHGLGLYIAAYYAKALNTKIEIDNIYDPSGVSKVRVRLSLPSAFH